MKYRIYTYDVWGNEKEGFEVNDVFSTPYIVDLPGDPTDAQIVQAMKRAGYLKKGLKIKSVDFSYNDAIMRDDSTPIFFSDARNGKPDGELRREDDT